MIEELRVQMGNHYRVYVTRARLTGKGVSLTPVGRELESSLNLTGGMTVVAPFLASAGGYGVTVQLADPDLWSWDDVEPAIFGAFRVALGASNLKVVRVDVHAPAGRTPTATATSSAAFPAPVRAYLDAVGEATGRIVGELAARYGMSPAAFRALVDETVRLGVRAVVDAAETDGKIPAKEQTQ